MVVQVPPSPHPAVWTFLCHFWVMTLHHNGRGGGWIGATANPIKTDSIQIPVYPPPHPPNHLSTVDFLCVWVQSRGDILTRKLPDWGGGGGGGEEVRREGRFQEPVSFDLSDFEVFIETLSFLATSLSLGVKVWRTELNWVFLLFCKIGFWQVPLGQAEQFDETWSY